MNWLEIKDTVIEFYNLLYTVILNVLYLYIFVFYMVTF